MRRTVADYTELARESLGHDVELAVPADRRSHINRNGTIRPKLMVFRAARIDVHRRTLLGQKPGRLLESIPFARRNLVPGQHPLEAELWLDTDRWFIHGWYARDLRAALDALGANDNQEAS